MPPAAAPGALRPVRPPRHGRRPRSAYVPRFEPLLPISSRLAQADKRGMQLALLVRRRADWIELSSRSPSRALTFICPLCPSPSATACLVTDPGRALAAPNPCRPPRHTLARLGHRPAFSSHAPSRRPGPEPNPSLQVVPGQRPGPASLARRLSAYLVGTTDNRARARFIASSGSSESISAVSLASHRRRRRRSKAESRGSRRWSSEPQSRGVRREPAS